MSSIVNSRTSLEIIISFYYQYKFGVGNFTLLYQYTFGDNNLIRQMKSYVQVVIVILRDINLTL